MVVASLLSTTFASRSIYVKCDPCSSNWRIPYNREKKKTTVIEKKMDRMITQSRANREILLSNSAAGPRPPRRARSTEAVEKRRFSPG